MQYTVISPGIYTYGAMLIAGTIRNAGKKVDLKKDLTAARGDTVFLSLYSTLHLLNPQIREFIEDLHKAGGKCYIGGPVSAYPEMVLGELRPDAVILGEGEVTVRHIVAGAKIQDIEGVAYRSGSTIVIRKRDPSESIEHPVPFIPRDIGSQSIRGANAYLESHRGCSGACTFCQVPRFFGHAIRSREIPAIKNEALAFKNAGAQRIALSGGTGSLFQAKDGALNPTAFIELLAALADVMGKNNVSCPDIRVDCITDEILDAISRYTIGWVFFGIESGSDAILRKMGKGVTIAQVCDAIRRCREHGLRVAGSFIVGYPTETQQDYENTKDFIAEQQLDDIFISIAEPIPSTPLAALVLKIPRSDNPVFVPTTGEYKPFGLTEAEARCFDLMLHADLCKPVLHITTDAIYDAYLAEAKKQGAEIRAVTELLFRYHEPKDRD
ncbi:MAG: methyl-coenzyme M reductase glutamine C-methyltransferase [Methanoregula sp.]|jgi:B12-binding domain/radical SAM domain protein